MLQSTKTSYTTFLFGSHAQVCKGSYSWNLATQLGLRLLCSQNPSYFKAWLVFRPLFISVQLSCVSIPLHSPLISCQSLCATDSRGTTCRGFLKSSPTAPARSNKQHAVFRHPSLLVACYTFYILLDPIDLSSCLTRQQHSTAQQLLKNYPLMNSMLSRRTKDLYFA